MSTLVIDALIYKRGKAYGYQEYLFGLLDFFYTFRADLSFSRIVIACEENQVIDFEKYADKLTIKSFRAASKIKQLWFQNRLKVKLHLQPSDVILFTYNYSALLRQCHHVLVIHDLLYLRKQLLPNTPMRWQRKFWIPRSLRLADHIIAISDFTRKDIENHFRISPQRIETIYNAFNFQKYNEADHTPLTLPSPYYFLSVCSTAAHKNSITVFRAFAAYCKENKAKDIHLVLVGSLGHPESDVSRFYHSCPPEIQSRIHILSSVSNAQLAKLYQECLCYISASLFEGLGMPIIEAMYFNVPVVLSDLPVCHEVSSEAGIYFNPHSEKDLSAIMRTFVNKKLLSCINTRDEVLDKYSEHNTSRKYINSLNAVVNTHNHVQR